MPEDAMRTKERIISLLRMSGPSLPVHVSKATGLSILFSSAFLSELFYESKIKISNLKVGSSPLYFLPGQEYQLERFAQYLKGKEKEAFNLIKEKRFLKDSEQEPAIRVALRELKDFAIPFKKDEEMYWRYFTSPKEELVTAEKPKEEIIIQKEVPKEETKAPLVQKKETKKAIPEKKKVADIFETPKREETEKKKPARKRGGNKRHDDKFFNRVKESLSKKSIEIIDIQDFNKSELILKVKENKEEKMLIAYNKKRLTEEDLIKAYKKSAETDLPCIVLGAGELSKKFKDLISAIKGLNRIDEIEQ